VAKVHLVNNTRINAKRTKIRTPNRFENLCLIIKEQRSEAGLPKAFQYLCFYWNITWCKIWKSAREIFQILVCRGQPDREEADRNNLCFFSLEASAGSKYVSFLLVIFLSVTFHPRLQPRSPGNEDGDVCELRNTLSARFFHANSCDAAKLSLLV
jgi:hypothetical protein